MIKVSAALFKKKIINIVFLAIALSLPSGKRSPNRRRSSETQRENKSFVNSFFSSKNQLLLLVLTQTGSVFVCTNSHNNSVSHRADTESSGVIKLQCF